MNEQMREILDIINEMSEESTVELHDEFDIELSEDTIIESGVIDINEDGILIEGDDLSLQLLEEHGLILEDADWSKYDEPTISRIKKGKTEPVDTTDYNTPTYIRKQEGPKPKTGYDKRRADLKKLKADEGVMPFDKVKPQKAEPEILTKDGPDAKRAEAQLKLARKFGGWNNVPAEEKARLKAAGLLEKEDIEEKMIMGLPGDQGSKVMGALEEADVEESGLQAYLGKKKYGEKGMKALQQAGREGAGKEEMAKLRAKFDKLDEVEVNEAEVDEAKYQGREVPLGKPMAGDVKKRKVYVKKPNGKVVKVNFGDKKMRIKKSNPKRRKSFRARHNCKNPGPRWKARYWSCRAW